MKVKSESEVDLLCPTLHDPMDCSLPGSSIHGIFQARVLEWVAIYETINVELVISSKFLLFELPHLNSIYSQILLLEFSSLKKVSACTHTHTHTYTHHDSFII